MSCSLGIKFFLAEYLFVYDNNQGLLIYTISEVLLVTLFSGFKKSEDCFSCFTRCDDCCTYSIFQAIRKYKVELEVDSQCESRRGT